MMGSLNGATSILRNWIHFNNLSNIKVSIFTLKKPSNQRLYNLKLFYIISLKINFILTFSSQLMTFVEFFQRGDKHMKMGQLETTFTKSKTIPRKLLRNIIIRQKVNVVSSFFTPFKLHNFILITEI